ncbi:hypothetical protein BSKO_05775 [Bryopsis sp. KO-2023]|nr:hypothetical protein BSKO_05775 [Bryopsis sp. KO-2023]
MKLILWNVCMQILENTGSSITQTVEVFGASPRHLFFEGGDSERSVSTQGNLLFQVGLCPEFCEMSLPVIPKNFLGTYSDVTPGLQGLDKEGFNHFNTASTCGLPKIGHPPTNKKAELKDLDLHFQAEREDLLNDVRELTQQLKLKDLSIACSIPPKYQEKIMAHCKYSEYDGSWQIEHVQFAGNSIRAQNEASHVQETMDGDLDSSLLHGDSGALANVYFSYETLVEELGMMAERGDRPESRNRPKSGPRIGAKH